MDEPSYSLDARGALSALSPGGSAALAAREGRWALCPTGPDQLLFVRSPVEGGRGEPGRVVLSGDLSGFALADLLAFLGQSRWSGTIRVLTPAGARSAVLQEGDVRGASSDDPRDALGAVIVRLGHVDEARMAQALAEVPAPRVGRLLVEQGVLKPHDLFACVNHQVGEIFDAIMLSNEGTFLLLDTAAVEKGAHAVQLSTQSLLMDAIRKVDELTHYRRRIPHGRVYVTCDGTPDGALEDEEGRMFAAATGAKRLLELARELRLSEFEATSAAHRLLSRGLVRISEFPHGASAAVRGPVTPPPPRVAPALEGGASTSLDAGAVVAVYNAIFAEAFAEVARHGRSADFLSSANAALAHQAQVGGEQLLQALSFSDDGQLPSARLLEAWQQGGGTGDDASLVRLRRALSDVMFFLLFQTGELLESQADEKLAHRVKALLGTLDA